MIAVGMAMRHLLTRFGACNMAFFYEFIQAPSLKLPEENQSLINRQEPNSGLNEQFRSQDPKQQLKKHKTRA